MTLGRADLVLVETRRLLAEARAIVEGSVGDAPGEPAGTGNPSAARSVTVLSLYEELRARLAVIDDARVRELLGAITANVQEIGRLEADMEDLRDLRRGMAKV